MVGASAAAVCTASRHGRWSQAAVLILHVLVVERPRMTAVETDGLQPTLGLNTTANLGAAHTWSSR